MKQTAGQNTLYRRIQLSRTLQTPFAKSLGPEIGQTPSDLLQQEIGK